ncbi:TPA: hypothetical protein ACH9SQ_001462 [Escherichia coli]|uniref:hypothetical protein n=1 Tax=Escherichia coli TaxID=562 RepID=UPI000BE4854D|nr:hypothetical protein [Escherichia coli]EFM9182926.1 hypothetical protein [Escherichia coli]EHT4215886.1 hypothetical protein [Escherichia coli]EJE3107597.1 hypothetical protein [Escherichia coli]ELF8379305.1 hypothetical protein [Escherichia coli]MBC0581020.1 hypothetical protein [Escherichia coli]
MEIKKPTKKELYDYLLSKYIEDKCKEEADEINKKSMSRVKKHKERLMEITPEIFFRFLSEKGVSSVCPSCGSARLSIPESMDLCWDKNKKPENFNNLPLEEQSELIKENIKHYVSYTFFGDVKSIPDMRKTYYTLHCLNCGYLSLYRTSAVLKWLEKDKAQDGENG